MVTVSSILSVVFGVAMFVVTLTAFAKKKKYTPLDVDEVIDMFAILCCRVLVAALIGWLSLIILPFVTFVCSITLFVYWDVLKQKWKEWKDGRN